MEVYNSLMILTLKYKYILIGLSITFEMVIYFILYYFQFLVQHPTGCNRKVCVNEIFGILTKNRMKHLIKLMPTKKTTLVETVKKFNSLTTKIVSYILFLKLLFIV